MPVPRYWDLGKIKPDSFAISCKIREFGNTLIDQTIYSNEPEPPFHPFQGNSRTVFGNHIAKTKSGTAYQVHWKVEMVEIIKGEELLKQPPRICFNCFYFYQPILGGSACRKGLILPIKKGTCKKYEGWISFNEDIKIRRMG